MTTLTRRAFLASTLAQKSAVKVLANAGVIPEIQGIQWIATDPVAGCHVIGTGFDRCVILDDAEGVWLPRAETFTGEALYCAIDPSRQDAAYQAARRIDVACESNGFSGYYDLDAKAWHPTVRSPSPYHRCGTSVGYLPNFGVVQGFVDCHEPEREGTILMAETPVGVFEVGRLDGFVNGPWVAWGGALWNLTLRDHLVRGVRFDGVRIEVGGPWRIHGRDVHWSHEVFRDRFYYSEFSGRPGHNDATAYAVDLASGVRTPIVGGCQSFTFYATRDGSRLYVIGSLVEHTIIVGVSTDGLTVTEVGRLSHPGIGLAGSGATEDAKGRVIIPNTGRILGGWPMLLRVEEAP